jgi:hypothetical protein
MAEPKAKVKSADDMDSETFLKHINARHTPIGKMKVFGKSSVVGDEDEHLLRAYHDKIHDSYDDGFTSRYTNERVPDHIHAPARKA